MKVKTKPRTSPAEEPEETPQISVADLLARIDFSTDNVVAAAAENPVLFVKAIGYRLQCMRERSAAKMLWEQGQAGADLTIRSDARKVGEKVTERFIEEQVLLDPAVADMAKKFTEADELDEYSKLVVEAFRMRRDCLRIVGDLTRDELSLAKAAEAGMERMESTRSQLRKRFPGDT